MGRRARTLALSALTAAAAATACDDPLVVLGDSPGTLRIVAGIPDSAGHDLAARAVESLLDAPHGLAADADGQVYIADTRNARVLALAPSGQLTVLADHRGRTTEPRLQEPDGLALSRDGGLWIADPKGQRVWRLELASRELSPVAGSGVRGSAPDTAVAREAPLDKPTGVAVAPDGRLYFTEFDGHRVRRLDLSGTMVTVAGRGTPGFGGDDGPAVAARLRQPAGLALDRDVLYIADSGNHRIRALDLNRATIRSVAGTGVAAFSGDGGPGLAAGLNEPHALAIGAGGFRLFIADSENQRVRALDLETLTIHTFAGTGEVLFNGDLLAAGATALSGPRGLAVIGLELLYVSDSGHHVVRRTALTFRAAP